MAALENWAANAFCSLHPDRSGETRQTEISREIIESPRDQVIYYGSEREFSATSITGTVAYLSHGSVWIMRESSEARRPISQAADADGAVFDLTPDGGMLLYTRRPNRRQTINSGCCALRAK